MCGEEAGTAMKGCVMSVVLDSKNVEKMNRRTGYH